ncbi:1b978178-7ef3-4d20-9879-565ba129d60c [Sclerotinia trifoliorum]|uniref:1b978178-7ef3-4d20-9879-565ba129d60c n=1 Tax=Sclerotinia trifoliorum TaxID=28548 RepID=A0A8H2W743_9HELO|nr:1b978178-7ef3-4d20-9879-565ba129d60c [Sclerotinia trifoliorum]
MCVEQEVRCTGCNESSTSVYICSRLKRWQRSHKKIISHRRCGDFSISLPRKQTSLAHMDCPIRPEQEYTDYHNEEAFMYDYAPRCPSPIQTYRTYPPPYSVPYPYYPSWCV